MDLRLFSIEQMPRDLPIWETILDDLGRPAPARIARALGVGPSTVYRWNAAGRAPRMAALALFWLTRWGRSAVNAQAINDALMAVSLARSLREECNRLQGLANPGALSWPAIEPAQVRAEVYGQTLTLRGKDEGRFALVGTETSPPQPFLRAHARSNSRACPADSPRVPGIEGACGRFPPAALPALRPASAASGNAPGPSAQAPTVGARGAANTARQGAGTRSAARSSAAANNDSASSKAPASRPERPASLGLSPQTPAPMAPAPACASMTANAATTQPRHPCPSTRRNRR